MQFIEKDEIRHSLLHKILFFSTFPHSFKFLFFSRILLLNNRIIASAHCWILVLKETMNLLFSFRFLVSIHRQMLEQLLFFKSCLSHSVRIYQVFSKLEIIIFCFLSRKSRLIKKTISFDLLRLNAIITSSCRKIEGSFFRNVIDGNTGEDFLELLRITPWLVSKFAYCLS